MANTPKESWKNEDMMAGVWTVFPHISIAGFDGGAPFGAAGKKHGKEGGNGDGERSDGAGGGEGVHAGRKKG